MTAITFLEAQHRLVKELGYTPDVAHDALLGAMEHGDVSWDSRKGFTSGDQIFVGAPIYPSTKDMLDLYEVDQFIAARKGVARDPESEANDARGADWRWGKHETELLRKLSAAANKFWTHYDPQDPGTAPTNREVIAWLKAEDVSDRVAEVMAQILRADKLPTGPRK